MVNVPSVPELLVPELLRSNSSGCVFLLGTRADEVLSVCFMRLFLSERRFHLNLGAPGRTLRPYSDRQWVYRNRNNSALRTGTVCPRPPQPWILRLANLRRPAIDRESARGYRLQQNFGPQQSGPLEISTGGSNG
jgi:hypothetical protein